MKLIRVGFGTDTHRLINGIPFYLGGIKLDHYKGAVGHSDADALIHAICDALLGAANLRDIGFHFPDTSEQNKGIDSKVILAKVVNLLENESYCIGNLDCTIQLQSPKLKNYIPLIKQTLSPILHISENEISIKAKTGEGLGYVGSEEGIDVQVVVLIYKK
jgi:2-C-methyl-D-erythritol 2,4-cyclodiphosphate synthase